MPKDVSGEVLAYGNFGPANPVVQLLPKTRLFLMNRSTAVVQFTFVARKGQGGTFVQSLGVAKWTVVGGDEWSSVTSSISSNTVTWALVDKEAIFSGGLLALNAVQDSVQIGDLGGNVSQRAYAGAVACVTTGVWHFVASVTSGAVSVSDGTTTQPVAPVGTPTSAVTNGVWYHFTVSVVAGTTYTVSGAGLILLGGTGVVAVA